MPKVEYNNIIFETEDHVSKIIINKPPLNVLNIDVMREVISALQEIRQLSSIKAVVIKGAGSKCFSAGVEVADHLPADVDEMLKVFHGMFREMIKLEAPTIAVINGYALGGGAELALFCDMVIASDKSQIGQPDIKLGAFAPLALAAYPFFGLRKKVYEFLFLGDNLSASEAERIGLVNKVVKEDDLDEAEAEFLEKLRRISSVSIKASKMAMAVSFNEQFEKALDTVEGIYLNQFKAAEDYVEGLTSFLEKRKPVWKEK